MSNRDNSMREMLWLAIRQANNSNSNTNTIPSSSTHLGVLLQYAIDNFINTNTNTNTNTNNNNNNYYNNDYSNNSFNYNDNYNDGNKLILLSSSPSSSPSPLKSSSNHHYHHPTTTSTPMTITPRLSGTRNRSFFSPNLSSSASSLLSPEFMSISYPGSRLGTPLSSSSTLDDKIKQQKSLLHSFRESI